MRFSQKLSSALMIIFAICFVIGFFIMPFGLSLWVLGFILFIMAQILHNQVIIYNLLANKDSENEEEGEEDARFTDN